jgi:hypothetical protein
MFTLRNRMILAGLVICAVLARVSAASAAFIVVDENGNGYLKDDLGNKSDLTGALMADPSQAKYPGFGLLGDVLVFALPFPPKTDGDVEMPEQPNYSSDSDVVRFVDKNLVFYSDAVRDEQTRPKADTGTPNRPLVEVRIRKELGQEGGLQGVSYTPGADDPGYFQDLVKGISGLTYYFVSDLPPNIQFSDLPEPPSFSAPEPATAALLVLGLCVIVTWKGGRRLVKKCEPRA